MPRDVVVYTGQGCSHSWIWLADMFEANSFHAVKFLDEREFIGALKKKPYAAIVSGGDAFAIASALSGEGFSSLKRFIRSGGEYVGVCAGAYLPLPTSVDPLSEFNVCSLKIGNIVSSSGVSETESPRLGVPFCGRVIVHPIRGEISLCFDGTSIDAPVFGGPIFIEPRDERVVGRFDRFTSSTEVQMDPNDAESMVIGRPAAVEAAYGQGKLLLFSPHLEHPRYPEANNLFMSLLGLPFCPDGTSESRQQASTERKGELVRAAADMSVAIVGLEGRSFLMGHKIWDAERMLVLVDAIVKRASSIPEAEAAQASTTLRSLRKRLTDNALDDPDVLESILGQLMAVARGCVNRHFEERSSGR